MLIKKTLALTLGIGILIAIVAMCVLFLPWWGTTLVGFAMFAVWRFFALHYYRWVRDNQDLTTREGQIIKDRMNRNINWLNGYFRAALNRAR